MAQFRNRAGEKLRPGPRRVTGPVAVPAAAAVVRRRLSPASARGLEILSHAIEYLADEYAVDSAEKGPLGNGDPRVQAIQTLKSLNRAVYFSGAEVQPMWQRLRRWWFGEQARSVGSKNAL